jgi:predicted hydrocarbon binding protein
MIGAIFQHLNALGTDVLGKKAWLELSLDHSKDSSYRKDADYPDESLSILVDQLAKKANLSTVAIWRKFGKMSTALFIKEYPQFLTPYDNPRDLLSNLNDMHYVGVRNIFSNAKLPYFYHQKKTEDKIILRYYSNRNLCFYFEGGLDGLGEFYQKPLLYKQTQCKHNGSDYCEFEIIFS